MNVEIAVFLRHNTPTQVWGRPAGLAVAEHGSLLVADAGKTVWNVTYTGK